MEIVLRAGSSLCMAKAGANINGQQRAGLPRLN